jgi:hypothetical protein
LEKELVIEPAIVALPQKTAVTAPRQRPRRLHCYLFNSTNINEHGRSAPMKFKGCVR